MTRYAVIGASSGTGRQIVRYLADKHVQVRAISRRPLAAQEGVEPYAADSGRIMHRVTLQGEEAIA